MSPRASSTLRPFLLGALALSAAACGGEEETPEPIVRSVRYVVVGRDDGASQRTFSGAVRAGSSSRLSFRVPGRVREVSVAVGDRVEPGDPIARLDPTDFQIQLQEARASAAQARAQARQAEPAYRRVRALYENQNASRSDLDDARAARDSAQSALAALGSTVRRLQNQLEYATLTAPAAGTISRVEVEANENVAAGQVVAELQVGEQLEVTLDVPESRVNDIARGDAASVRIDALQGLEVEGTVYEVGVPREGAAVFPVTVRLAEGEERIRAGMAAEVTFRFEALPDAPRHHLPPAAVGEDRDGRFVYVVERTEGERGVVHRRAVEVGEIGEAGLAIEAGVEDGELVVTAGVSRIHDGLEVRVPPREGDEGGEGGEERDEASADSDESSADEAPE